jgi:hypothetical protein
MWHGRRNFSISMTRLKCGMSQLAKNSIYINGECFTNSVIRQDYLIPDDAPRRLDLLDSKSQYICWLFLLCKSRFINKAEAKSVDVERRKHDFHQQTSHQNLSELIVR